jgi:hypothetical protein
LGKDKISETATPIRQRKNNVKISHKQVYFLNKIAGNWKKRSS